MVTAADPAAAMLFGRNPDQLVGTDFFGAVAPASRRPGFFGRFLDAVHGRGGARLSASFTLEQHTVSTEVHILAEDNRVRVQLRVLDLVASPPRRSGQLAVERRTNAESIDPSICEQEPIHLPGTIQGHAALIAVDPATRTVLACSSNFGEILAIPVQEILGAEIGRLLHDQLADEIFSNAAADRSRPVIVRARLGGERRPFELHAHARDGLVLIEFEEAPEDDPAFAAATASDIQQAIRTLRAATTLEELTRFCAQQARRLTGFERVLVYRFDEQWNGEVIAEDLAEDGLHSLLGLHFPASDIPAQARALYRTSPSRFVLDRDEVPAPLLSAETGVNAQIDLGLAQFRSLSPIHVEYQRNLGVNGSMSVSIIIGGELWGLIIGHHRQPHYVAPDSRKAVEILSDMLAVRVADILSTNATARQHRGLTVQTELLQRMAQGDDYVKALTGRHMTVLDLFSASGAFVVRGEEITSLGEMPGATEMRDLVAWIRSQGKTTVETPHLAREYPPAESFAAVASGLLAVVVDPAAEHILGWLKPEVVSVLSWGGDPNKPLERGSGSTLVLPRRSFERWTEERRGRSQPWLDWQVRIAETLAVSLEGVILRQQRRIAVLNATQRELEAALVQKDLLSREIDHRVKNSLQIVASFLQMQGRTAADPLVQSAFDETYARVMSVARVHDSLYQSENIEEVDLGQTIKRLCGDLAAMAGQERTLETDVAAGVMTPYKTAMALSLVATELVTNAFKHAGNAGPTRVGVSLKSRPGGGIRLTVCDNGVGLPGDWAERTHSGLGMRLVRAMLQQLGGRLEADGTNGACFHVDA